MAATKTSTIVMTEGRPLPQIIRFSVPLALTGILQLLFNAADVIVVGKFDSSTALAAVGATTSLINLLIGAFIGGVKDKKKFVENIYLFFHHDENGRY